MMRVQLIDPLLGLLSQHKMIVIHTSPKQGPPNNRIRPNTHPLHKLESFKHHPGTAKKINHTAIMLKRRFNTILTPHAVKNPPPLLHEPAMTTSHQRTHKRNTIRLQTRFHHAIKRLQSLPATSMDGEAVNKSGPSDNVSVRHFIKHLNGTINIPASGPRDQVSVGHFVEQFEGHVEKPARAVRADEGVLDVDIGMESEFENEGVDVVGVWFLGFEDEGEGEVVEGDIGSVHVGEEGEGQGRSVERHVADHGVVGEGVAGDGETEEHRGGVSRGVGG
ncbi:hypothetical protein CR513_51699, partial [Mucuna pruriens]